MYDGKLIIFTCFYKYDVLSTYTKSLYQTAVVLEKLGIKHDYWTVENCFHIESAMASTLTKFAHDPEATDILLIDADESWNPEDVVKLLMWPQAVVGGTARMKNNWEQYVGRFKKDKDGDHVGIERPQGVLLEMDRIPAGFLRLKKEVLLKYIETYPEDYFILEGQQVYKFFWNEIKDRIFTGMDYCFSDKVKNMGYQLWVDPTIRIGHWGTVGFEGDYDKYLRGLKAIQDVEKMNEELLLRKEKNGRGL